MVQWKWMLSQLDIYLYMCTSVQLDKQLGSKEKQWKVTHAHTWLIGLRNHRAI